MQIQRKLSWQSAIKTLLLCNRIFPKLSKYSVYSLLAALAQTTCNFWSPLDLCVVLFGSAASSAQSTAGFWSPLQLHNFSSHTDYLHTSADWFSAQHTDSGQKILYSSMQIGFLLAHTDSAQQILQSSTQIGTSNPKLMIVLMKGKGVTSIRVKF